MPKLEHNVRRGLWALLAAAALLAASARAAAAAELQWQRVLADPAAAEPAPLSILNAEAAAPTTSSTIPHAIPNAIPPITSPAAPWGPLARQYAPLIDEVAQRYTLDPMLIHAVIKAESAYCAQALSSKGAVGLMQLMPATAQRFGKVLLSEPRDNLEAGAAYLQSLMLRFGGQLDLVLAGYNAGEGAVAQHGNMVPPYPETRAYVDKVLRYYAELKSGSASGALALPMPAAARPASAPLLVSGPWEGLNKLAQLLLGGKTKTLRPPNTVPPVNPLQPLIGNR